MKSLLAIATVLLTTLLLVSVPAHAGPTPCTGTFESSLDFGDTALNGFTGPFGQVCITLASSTVAHITFTTAGTYLFVDGSSSALNVNATAFTESGLTEMLNGGAGPTGAFATGSQNVDGEGNFNLTVNNGNSGPTGRADTIMFTVTDTSGTWANAGNVLILNGNGFDAAAHIGAGLSNGNFAATGFAGEDAGGTIQGGPVPEPNLVLLSLIGGVFAIVVSRRRRQNAKS